MAAGKISIQANDGKVAGVVFEDGASSNVTVTVPKEGGVVATEAYADTKVSKTGDEPIGGVKTFSSNTIFNGNVGIGTASPSKKLQIVDTSNQLSLTTSSQELLVGVSSSRALVSTFPSIPIVFATNLTERMRIDTAGNVLVTGSGGLGYGTGAGGVVTQLTSKSTAVTLNKPSGIITMNNDALAAGASVSFVVNNTIVSATGSIIDNVIVSIYSGISCYSSYRVQSTTLNGVFVVTLTNQTGISLSEAVLLKFDVIKGAIA